MAPPHKPRWQHVILVFLGLLPLAFAQGNLFGAAFGSSSSGCVLEREQTSQSMYKVYVPNRGYMTFTCAPGTVFVEEKCGCDFPEIPSGTGGRPPISPPSGAGTGTGTGTGNGPKTGGAIGKGVDGAGTATNTGTWPGTGTGTGTGTGVSTGRKPATFRPGSGVPTIVPPLWTTRLPGGWTTLAPGATTREPCRYRPGSDRHFYEEYIFGFGWRERLCPLGTLYNNAKCACHDLEPITVLQCRPEFYLDFDSNDIRDSAGSNIPIGNNGDKKITSVRRAGRFDGSGILTVWRYSNTDFGKELTINLRFYDFPGGDDEQILVSNCYAQQMGSVEVALDQRSKEVIFRGDTVSSPPQEIRIPFRDQAWKNVTLIYDGSFLRGRVDNEEKSAPMKGNLDVRYSGLLIGQCNGRRFYGYIDELSLYRCVRDQSGVVDRTGFKSFLQ